MQRWPRARLSLLRAEFQIPKLSPHMGAGRRVAFAFGSAPNV